MKLIKLFLVALLAGLILAPALHAGLLEKEVIRSDWFSIGGDVRVRQVGFNNIITWDSDNKADQQNFFRVRSRLYVKANPCEVVTATARLVNEWRYYFKPDGREHPLRDEIILDTASLDLNQPMDLPIKATLGRQWLRAGEGLLLMDGTPLDGSRTVFSDGAKISLDLEGRTLDFLAFYNDQEPWFVIHRNQEPLSGYDPGGYLDSQKIGVFGAYYTDPSLIDNQKLEAYYLFKYGEESPTFDANGRFPQNQISVIGARMSGTLDEKLAYAAEAAVQLGSYGGEPQQALGGYAHATYQLASNEDFDLDFMLGAVYLSGQDENDSNHQGWDPILGRWPKWSELYIYSMVPEKDIAYWTNMQIYQAFCNLTLIEKLKIKAGYQYLRANETYTAAWCGGGKERGHNPQFKATYPVTDWLSCHILGEYFVPGDFHASRDDGFFARWEVMGKF